MLNINSLFDKTVLFYSFRMYVVFLSELNKLYDKAHDEF